MSSSETSSNTSASPTYRRDESWEIGAAIGVLAAHGSSTSSECRQQDAALNLQELTCRQWVALNLSDSKKCYAHFRLRPHAFLLLHDTLVSKHGLRSTRQCDSIEALAMFLWACGTRQCQRQIAYRFRRSPDTVSRKFGEVLDALVSFADTIIRPKDPTFRSVHPRLHQFSPYFDGCIGAIDGTHILVSVMDHVHDDFINRKGFTSQNVLAVCDMDMRFTFVAAGKTGAAHDMSIFRAAINDSDHFPHPPPGKYYLVDSGYPLREGYMAPHRRTRYHLKEFEAKAPENLHEIFNFHHSSLRNVVERSFGVLKSKWQILQGIPLFPMEKQSKIIVARFALHNFALENNGSGVGSVYHHETFVNRTREGNELAIDWLWATATDDIGTVRDWIAFGLYGLA